MADQGPKLKFSLPVGGVIPDEHPGLIGTGMLTDAENWIYRNKRLETRTGIEKHQSSDAEVINFLTPNQSNLQDGVTTGFTALGTTAISVPAIAPVSPLYGSHVLFVDAPPGGVQGVETDAIYINSPTADHFASVYVRWVAGGDPSPTYNLYLDECNAAGSVIASSNTIFTVDPTGSKWLRISVKHTFTTGVKAKARIYRSVYFSGAADDFYLDGLMIEESSSVSSWVPGIGDLSATGPPGTGNLSYSGNLAQRPLGFFQWDALSAASILRNQIVCGTDEGWWLYDSGSQAWRNITKGLEIGDVTYTDGGGGLDDMTPGVAFTGDDDVTFIVEIDNDAATPETFKWYNDTADYPGSPQASAQNCSTSPITLQDGHTIVFGATTGHVNGDKWQWTAQADTPLTGSSASQVVFKGYDIGGSTKAIGVNHKDRLMVYDVGDDHYEPGADATVAQPLAAKCIATCAGYVIAGNFTYSGTYYHDAIIYSNYRDASPGGYGGWPAGAIIRCSTTPGEIVSLTEMGQLRVAIYKSDSIFMLTQQAGSSYPFRLDRAATGISGPVAPNAVVTLPDGTHAYLAKNGSIMLFDGTPPRTLGKSIQNYVRSRMDKDSLNRAWGFYDGDLDELQFFFPAIGTGADEFTTVISRAVAIKGLASPQGGISMWPMSWDPTTFDLSAGLHVDVERAIPIGDWPPLGSITVPIGALKSTITTRLVGDSGGQIYREGGNQDDGNNFTAVLETGITDFGDQTRQFVVKEIDHLFDVDDSLAATTTQNIDVQLRKDYGERSEELTPAKTVNAGSTRVLRTQHRVIGRSFGLRLEASVEKKTYWSGSEAVVAPHARGRR